MRFRISVVDEKDDNIVASFTQRGIPRVMPTIGSSVELWSGIVLRVIEISEVFENDKKVQVVKAVLNETSMLISESINNGDCFRCKKEGFFTTMSSYRGKVPIFINKPMCNDCRRFIVENPKMTKEELFE